METKKNRRTQVHTVGEVSYHVNKRLYHHWNKNSLEKMKKNNSDRVYIVDGMERIGKTWWTFQQSGVIDKKMWSSVDNFLKRVCFTPDDFFHAIRTIKNGVVIFDEAFRGLSSRSALSRINKRLISGLMEMGQNNNIVFIVLPRIWLLDIYPAMLRSHGLFNISLDKKNNKRVWRGYNQHDKNQIYQIGAKKGWKYVIKTRFRGNFYDKFPGGEEFKKAYLKKKAEALKGLDSEKEGELDPRLVRFHLQRNLALSCIYNFVKSSRKTAELIKKYGIEVSYRELQNILLQVREFVSPDLLPAKKVVGLDEKTAEIASKMGNGKIKLI